MALQKWVVCSVMSTMEVTAWHQASHQPTKSKTLQTCPKRGAYKSTNQPWFTSKCLTTDLIARVIAWRRRSLIKILFLISYVILCCWQHGVSSGPLCGWLLQTKEWNTPQSHFTFHAPSTNVVTSGWTSTTNKRTQIKWQKSNDSTPWVALSSLQKLWFVELSGDFACHNCELMKH